MSVTAVTGTAEGIRVLNSWLEHRVPAELGFCSSVQQGKHPPPHIHSSLSLETQRHKVLGDSAAARAGERRKGRSSGDMDRLLGNKAEQVGVAPGRGMAWRGEVLGWRWTGGTGRTDG